MAKIQFSSGHNGEGGAEQTRFYHNINIQGEKDPEKDPRDSADTRLIRTITAGEMSLVKEAGLIFTKNAIIGKAVNLFAGLSEDMTLAWDRSIWSPSLTAWLPAMAMAGAKISRGENYRGLPWVVLDHPRLFTKEDVFAIRTLFWWGHYFSVTLHLKGVYKERWLPVIRRNLSLLSAAEFHICISEDEWRHELATDNYLSLAEARPGQTEAVLEKASFLKFSAAIPLTDWNEAPTLLLRLFTVLLEALSAQR